MTIGQNDATIGVCMTSQYHNNGAAVDRWEFSLIYPCFSGPVLALENHVRNKMIYGPLLITMLVVPREVIRQ